MSFISDGSEKINNLEPAIEPVNILLTNWVNEQRKKINQILGKISLITYLQGEDLDELCNYLDDIDFYISGLDNILNLVVGNNNDISEQNNANVIELPEPKPELNRWVLLEALWFHMIMASDPDSIYYSKNIGNSSWTSDIQPGGIN